MILGTGIDLVEIARFRRAVERSGERFLDRLFLPEERRYCDTQRDPIPCYAARFAAKEAVSKALGTGIGARLEWHDLRIGRYVSGQPFVELTGLGAETAQALNIEKIHLSLSHTEHQAIAQAIAEGRTISFGPC